VSEGVGREKKDRMSEEPTLLSGETDVHQRLPCVDVRLQRMGQWYKPV